MQQFIVSRGSKLGSVSQQSRELEQSRQELFYKLRRQQAANKAFKELCKEALSKTFYKRTGQKIKGIKVINNGIALTGFINTSREELKIN